MKDRETFRKMARELSADSIVMDALARYTEQVIEAAGTTALDSKSVRETKALHAIMLVAEGGCAVVKIEIGGQWIELIRESLDGPFSHIIEPSGIDRRTSEGGKDE